MPGKFIVIEGPNGSGKSTLVKNLTQLLVDNGVDAIAMKFPQYGHKAAGPVEEYLSGKYGDVHEVGPYRGSILYAVDRYDASFKIRELVDQNKIIICDRYMASNMAHQGCEIPDDTERQTYYDWLLDLEFNIFKIPKPDVNLIIQVPPETSHQLVEERAKTEGKDIQEKDLDYHKLSHNIYMELKEIIPNVKLFNGAPDGSLLSKEAMAQEVYAFLQQEHIL